MQTLISPDRPRQFQTTSTSELTLILNTLSVLNFPCLNSGLSHSWQWLLTFITFWFFFGFLGPMVIEEMWKCFLLLSSINTTFCRNIWKIYIIKLCTHQKLKKSSAKRPKGKYPQKIDYTQNKLSQLEWHLADSWWILYLWGDCEKPGVWRLLWLSGDGEIRVNMYINTIYRVSHLQHITQ